MNDFKNEKWTLWYSVEWLREQVENLTAAIATRPDNNGNINADLMLTADQDELFRRLMRDALNDVRTEMLALVDPEHGSDESEREKVIHLHLNVPVKEYAGECPAVVRALDDLVRQFLITRILWGWMRLVNPNECGLYTDELDSIKKNIGRLAKSERWKGVRRRYHYF